MFESIEKSMAQPAVQHGTVQYYQNSRKKACAACRHRKKRCDGNRPACSACSKWNVECIYSPSPSPIEYQGPLVLPPTMDLENGDAQMAWGLGGYDGFSQMGTPSVHLFHEFFSQSLANSNMNLEISSSYSPSLPGLSDFGDAMNMLPSLNTSDGLSSPASPGGSMASQAQMVELAQIFFEQDHSFLPCIDQQNFMDRLNDPAWAASSPLVWAILSVAARRHNLVAIQSQHKVWHQKALQLLDQSIISQGNTLRDIQAAIWNIYLHYISGNSVKASLLLAQAYTLACLYGLTRIDDDRRPSHVSLPFSNAAEEEECRSTMWALFILDRHNSFLHGLHFVINDRLFYVDYPRDVSLLQTGFSTKAEGREQFTRDLASLQVISLGGIIGVPTVRLLQKAIVLLGRITEYGNFVPLDSNQKQRADEFRELQSSLTRFWLSLPESLSSITNTPPKDVPHTTWLIIILHTCSILLDYPTSVCGKSGGVLKNFVSDAGESRGFLQAFNSVQAIIDVVKQTSSVSASSLVNPFLAPSYFLCCRFLLARWRQTQKQSHRFDVDLLVALFDRMSEMGIQLSQRFKELVEQDLQNDGQIVEDPTGVLMLSNPGSESHSPVSNLQFRNM